MRRTTKTWIPLLTVVTLATASVAANACNGEKKMQWVQSKFGQVDTNGDNTITKEEQIAFAQKRFDMSDTNQDGLLTLEEIEMKHLKRRMERLEKNSNP